MPSTSIGGRSATLWAGVAASLITAATLNSRSGGVASGVNSAPSNLSSQMPSCQGSCHSSSGPFAGRTNPPVATLAVTKLALAFGEVTSVTTSVSGGVSGTKGGFACEVSAGAFTPGANSHSLTGATGITHLNNSFRSWTYSYTAPSVVGPVSLTSVAMTSNGSGSSGDKFSFAGFDPNATVATPVRLYVLPTGVTNRGSSCADGYGNLSVIGGNSTPSVGNAGFAVGLISATPSTVAVLFLGVNPPGFVSVPLDFLLGLTGCSAHVANIANSLTAFTSGGSVERAEGTASFPIPLPNVPSLVGATFDVQALYIDPSVASFRALPFSLSNGLNITIQ